MQNKIRAIALISAATLSFNGAALAQDSLHTGFLGISVGYYDVLDDQDGVDLRLEYRPNSSVFIENLRPWFGAEVTSQGSLWGGGGLSYDWAFAENLYLSPSLGIGFYSDGGSDVDLDYPLQFRTQLDLAYEMQDTSRIGVSLSHMSNGGLGDSNPGTEVASIFYHLPLNKLF